MISTQAAPMGNLYLFYGWLVVLVCLSGLRVAAEDYPWLAELDAETGVKASGLRLMNLNPGLHPLEQDTAQATQILVGVHGFGSQGYEWVYPLQTLDDETTLTFFHRWNTFQCTDSPSVEMARSLGTVLANHPNIKSVTIIGHSYGGLMAIGFIKHWIQEVSTHVHTVAAPLAGTGNGCTSKLPLLLPPNVGVTQWRTIQALDNAFKDWPDDPQVVDIPGSTVTRLPETYRGRRLGHNWSISWVAENI